MKYVQVGCLNFIKDHINHILEPIGLLILFIILPQSQNIEALPGGLVTGENGICFRVTGKQRLIFEGNKYNIREPIFRYLGNRGTSHFFFQ